MSWGTKACRQDVGRGPTGEGLPRCPTSPMNRARLPMILPFNRRPLRPRVLWLMASLMALACCTSAPLAPAQRTPTRHSPLTALDHYVGRPDPAYSWKLADSIRAE